MVSLIKIKNRFWLNLFLLTIFCTGQAQAQAPFPLSVKQDHPVDASGFHMKAAELSEQTELPPALKSFIIDELIPKESVYFKPGIGLDPVSGMPFDHVRVRLQKGVLAEIGNYTAASKLSLSIPYLLGIIQKKPEFKNAQLLPEQAEELLLKALQSLLRHIRDYPEYEGFLPWVDIRPNGTIAPATTKMPSLDNGQLSWALASVVAAFEKSGVMKQRKLAKMADDILHVQNYRKFYDSKAGLLHGTIQKDPFADHWTGDASYYLNDMFEGTLAVLWGVLNGQIPEDAWHNLDIPTVDYVTSYGEKVTTLQGFRASFHEHWALIFLPFMKSELGPLYSNFLYAQADYARRHQMPGFLSTAYDPKGIYRQMGLPAVAKMPVDRGDVSVVFATAMGMLIEPTVGATWLKHIYEFGSLVSPFGAVESVGKDGYSDIFTADAKGITLLAASGGVLEEVETYLRNHTVPNTNVSMFDKFLELLHQKYEQMLELRKGEPVFMPQKPFALPSTMEMSVRPKNPPDPGPVFSVTAHLQKGHLHGKNVRSIGYRTLEDDVQPDHVMEFEYEIPPHYPYFDQWAFRGTYIDQAVQVSKMQYLSFSIPADLPPQFFEIELKSDDVTLATALVDTSRPGVLSADGKRRTLVEKIEVIPESVYKPFNYFSVTISDPNYLSARFWQTGRKGVISLDDVKLLAYNPNDLEHAAPVIFPNENRFELLKFWRPSHGDLGYVKDRKNIIYRLEGGVGWRGGYMPYTDVGPYRFIYFTFKNLSVRPNRLTIEIKRDEEHLLGRKLPIELERSKKQQVFELDISEGLTGTINYFAISDPSGMMEISSILLTKEPILDLEATPILLLPEEEEAEEEKCSFFCWL